MYVQKGFIKNETYTKYIQDNNNLQAYLLIAFMSLFHGFITIFKYKYCFGQSNIDKNLKVLFLK